MPVFGPDRVRRTVDLLDMGEGLLQGRGRLAQRITPPPKLRHAARRAPDVQGPQRRARGHPRRAVVPDVLVQLAVVEGQIQPLDIFADLDTISKNVKAKAYTSEWQVQMAVT